MSKRYGTYTKSKKGSKTSQMQKGQMATIQGNIKEMIKKKNYLEKQLNKQINELYNLVNNQNETNRI